MQGISIQYKIESMIISASIYTFNFLSVLSARFFLFLQNDEYGIFLETFITTADTCFTKYSKPHSFIIYYLNATQKIIQILQIKK